MEAVPRLPMVSFDLKVSPDRPPTDFNKLKQYIREFYNEDPDSYSTEIRNLESLRAQAVHPIKDVNGLSILKKYYCQLHFLQSRFPMEKDGAASVAFSWRDIYSTMVTTYADIKYEIVSILYNVGALHTQMGASHDRTSPEGLKMACTHFQCAAWAFQHIKDSFPQPAGMDLSPDVMHFMYHLCLAQAQECILEKSMTDNRKATINAKVATQIIDYYNLAYAALTQQSEDPSTAITETVGSKLMKYWKRYVKFKSTYYGSISLLYQGMQSEEQQKMGERVAYYQAAMDKLNETIKLSKAIDQVDGVDECMSFTRDVVEGKRKAAKSENEFIYHEEVPDIDSLTPVKGATLVKGIPFSVTDPDISGLDIFAKLIPLKAHQASSMYSEEKAKLLRKVNAEIDAKDEEVVSFMSCLQLEHIKAHQTASNIPQEVVDRCAALSANQDAIPNLIAAMDKLNDAYHDVDAMLQEIMALIKTEEASEASYQEVMGKRPPSIVATDLKREANKYMEAHKKAADSNETLNRAMGQHIENLRVLQQPLASLQQKLPSLDSLNLGDDESLKEVTMLVGKVDEMRRQRAILASQLRESITSDDITVLLVTSSDNKLQEIFSQELQKHDRYIKLIEQNLVAQEKILSALTEAYANYAPTRKATAEIMKQRDVMLSALVSSYDAYEDLLAKSAKGLEFYRKLETNLTKLVQRVKGTCRVQQEERDAILVRNNVKLSDEKVPQPPASATPKLKDYLAKRKETANANPAFGTGYDGAWGVRPAPVGSEVSAPLAAKMDGSIYPYNVNSLQYPSIGSDLSLEATAPADRPESLPEQPYLPPLVPGASYSGPYGTNTVTSPQAGYLTSQVYNGSMASVSTDKSLHPPPHSTATSTQTETQTPYTPSKINQHPAATYTVSANNSYHAPTSPAASPNPQAISQANAYNAYYQNYYQQFHSNPANPYSGYSAAPDSSGSAMNAVQGTHIPQTAQPQVPRAPQPQVLQNTQLQVGQLQISGYTSGTTSANYFASSETSSTVNPSVALQTGQPAASVGHTHPYSSPIFSSQSPASNVPSTYNANSALAVNQSSNYGTTPCINSKSSTNQTCMQDSDLRYNSDHATLNYAVPNQAGGYNPGPVSGTYPLSYVQSSTAVQPNYVTPPVNSTFGAANNTIKSGLNDGSQGVMASYAAVNQSAPANYAANQSAPVNYIQNPSASYPGVSQSSTLKFTVTSQPVTYYNSAIQTPNVPLTQSSHINNYPPSNSTPTYGSPASNLNYAASYQANQAQYAAQSNPLNYSKTNVASYDGINSFSQSNYQVPGNYQTNAVNASGGNYSVQSTGYNDPSSVPVSGSQSSQGTSYSVHNNSQPAGYGSQNQTAGYSSQNGHHAGYASQNPAGIQNTQVGYSYPANYQSYPPPYNAMQYAGYYNYQSSGYDPTRPTPESNVAQVSTTTVAPSSTSSSNVDLLAGLDFAVTETPLKPDPLDSLASLSISKETLSSLQPSETTASLNKTESINEQIVEAEIEPVKPEPGTEVCAPSPQPTKDPLSDPEILNQFVQEVEKFEKFVEGLCEKTLSGPTPLDIKWNELQDLQEKGSHKQNISVARCYPMKNRFPDFLPYDTSRVALPSTKDDYINASMFKPTDPSVPDMILTQSPLPTTYSDFWTMIMQQHVELIVCLLADSQMENHIYWPISKSEEVVLAGGTIKVTLESCNVRTHWVERLMSLTVQDVTRVIVHLQFTAWPNRWAESDGCGPWLALVAETVSLWRAAKARTPVTVHCDGGVGRSGLFAVTALLVAAAAPRLPEVNAATLAVASARKNPLRDRDHLKLAYQILLYHCQDILMKRGIFSSKGSNFDEKRPSKSKSHTRHPSQDFLLNSNSTSERRLSSQSDAGSTSSKGANAEIDPLSQLDPLWSLKKQS